MRKDQRLNLQTSMGYSSSCEHHIRNSLDEVGSRSLGRTIARLGGVMLSVSCLGFGAVPAHAQPVGWTQVRPIVVTENSGAPLSGYQLRMVVDTSAMAPGAADLRFGTDTAGTSILEHWIESGAGTANTVVWVKLASIAASAQTLVYQFSGNPAATDASSIDVFDYDSVVNNSATLQVANGGMGGVTDSQRGFRFQPNEDILLVSLGKREPNGTTRYITLFDAGSQGKLAQMQVSGPAAIYSYRDLQQPMWLNQGVQYVLSIYQGSSDGYYYGTSSQINPKLTYLDMRYCNNCTQDTFPTNELSNFHYGYPDFQFRTRQQVSVAPTWAYAALAEAPTIEATSGDGQASFEISPAANDGGSTIESYTVSCTPLGGGTALESTQNTGPLIVAGLTNGVTYRCTATAKNAIGVSAASSAIEVTPTAALAIASTNFGDLQVGKAFHLSLVASGGIAPYTWTATDVNQPLPLGLSLSSDGVLSGMPTLAGAYSTLVTVRDSSAAPELVSLRVGSLAIKAAGDPVTQVFSGSVAAVSAPSSTPVPVPTLGQWSLTLLSLVLMGSIGISRRSVRRS